MKQEETTGWKSLKEILEEAFSQANQTPDPKKGETYYKTLQSLKEYYRQSEQGIISMAKKEPCKWFRSYPMDWHSILTPIEWNVWCDIRSIGLIVLYPQYPVLEFYADFANPYFKIIVEVDGKEYHKDKQADYDRDKKLSQNGWTVFRLTGAETYKEVEYDGDEPGEDYEEYILKTSQGFIWALRNIFFANYTGEYLGLYMQALINHSEFYKP